MSISCANGDKKESKYPDVREHSIFGSFHNVIVFASCGFQCYIYVISMK